MEVSTALEFLGRVFKGDIYSIIDGLITVWTVPFGIDAFSWKLLALRLPKNHHTFVLYRDQLRKLEIKHVDLTSETPTSALSYLV